MPPETVELAVLLVDGGVPADPLTWLVRPERPVAPHITRGYGLTDAEVSRCGRFTNTHADVLAILSGRTLVAYRAGEAHDLLRAQLPGYQAEDLVDTLALAPPRLAGQLPRPRPRAGDAGQPA